MNNWTRQISRKFQHRFNFEKSHASVPKSWELDFEHSKTLGMCTEGPQVDLAKRFKRVFKYHELTFVYKDLFKSRIEGL